MGASKKWAKVRSSLAAPGYSLVAIGLPAHYYRLRLIHGERSTGTTGVWLERPARSYKMAAERPQRKLRKYACALVTKLSVVRCQLSAVGKGNSKFPPSWVNACQVSNCPGNR